MNGSRVIDPVKDERADRLARLIKRAQHAGGRGWCATTPLMIARYLVAAGVTLPEEER